MRRILISTPILLAIAACGDTALEQTAIGAGAGVGAAAVLGGSLATGAVIGAAGNVVYCQTQPGQC
jgi:hypothetical protein